MADRISPERRSRNMSRIRGKNTKPELAVRRYLHAEGLRYRLHAKELPGKPDIVFRQFKTVVFVNGCFWHGHANCKDFRLPGTRTEWWADKIGATVARDQRNYAQLEAAGWTVLVVWSCEVAAGRLEALAEELKRLDRARRRRPRIDAPD